MRPMRRQDRAVTDPEKIRAVIDACEVCRLGFQDGRGVYVVPVNFGHAMEDGRINISIKSNYYHTNKY